MPVSKSLILLFLMHVSSSLLFFQTFPALLPESSTNFISYIVPIISIYFCLDSATIAIQSASFDLVILITPCKTTVYAVSAHNNPRLPVAEASIFSKTFPSPTGVHATSNFSKTENLVRILT
jgi:hypothetical protein